MISYCYYVKGIPKNRKYMLKSVKNPKPQYYYESATQLEPEEFRSLLDDYINADIEYVYVMENDGKPKKKAGYVLDDDDFVSMEIE